MIRTFSVIFLWLTAVFAVFGADFAESRGVSYRAGEERCRLDVYHPQDCAGSLPVSGQVITHFAHRRAKGLSELTPMVDELAPLYHVRPDAPPYVIITGDRELELYGRYEENAYMWRMVGPALHIVKKHVDELNAHIK